MKKKYKWIEKCVKIDNQKFKYKYAIDYIDEDDNPIYIAIIYYNGDEYYYYMASHNIEKELIDCIYEIK